jgi:hypothetical protein
MADDNDKPLVQKHFLTAVCHGDVWTTFDHLDDTANGLMRGLNIPPDHRPLFELEVQPLMQDNRTTPTGSEDLREATRHQVLPPYKRYGHKTHYRIVFEEQGTPISGLKRIPDVMNVLADTVNGAFYYDLVHV